MKLALALVAFFLVGGACKGPKYTHNGVELQCSWPGGNSQPAVCVGGGKTYRCLGTTSGCGIEACGDYQVDE